MRWKTPLGRAITYILICVMVLVATPLDAVLAAAAEGNAVSGLVEVQVQDQGTTDGGAISAVDGDAISPDATEPDATEPDATEPDADAEDAGDAANGQSTEQEGREPDDGSSDALLADEEADKDAEVSGEKVASTEPDTGSEEDDAQDQKLAPGTYSVTANLSMPGQFNPVITGLTVYANSPDNPFADNKGASPVVDENVGVSINANVPSSPSSDNAQLIVAEDGAKTLVLMVRNPVFTTQELGSCPELPDVQVERTTPEDSSAWTYGKKSSRIHKIAAKLTDRQIDGQKSYDFSGSYLYAVPLEKAAEYGGASPDIRPDGDCALRLTVDYSSLKKQSDSTDVPKLVDLVDKTSGDGGDKGDSTDDKGDADDKGNADNADKGDADNNGGSHNNSASGGNDDIGTTTDGHLAAGTYTVSGNIWLPKSQTGLPLNPHITNSGFPPSEPVSSNATLVVDSSGHAYAYLPVVIQDKVMVVNSVSGSGVSYDGSTVTIDLGVPSASQSTFTGNCTVSVTIGWLAQTIAAGIFNGVWDHTWTAGWQVNLGSALPASGGGELPEAAKAILYGENGTTDGKSAKDAALSALKGGEEGAAGDDAAKGQSGSAKTPQAKGASDAVKSVEEAVESNPVLAVCAAALAVAAVALLARCLVAKRRKAAQEIAARRGSDDA